MKLALISFLISAILAGCARNSASTGAKHHDYIDLGDSEELMVAKMQEHGARDITEKTPFEFIHSISSAQRYYWWMLPDETIVAVLVTGSSSDTMMVAVVETSESGTGINGIRNWRSHDLTRKSSLRGIPSGPNAEQAGADQPATALDSKAE